MASKVYSATVIGMDAQPIEVETDVSYGLKVFDIVGLGDRAIDEAKERIGVALKSAGYKSPRTQPMKVLVNLAPADVKKEGALYDLPIALGFLLSSKQLRAETDQKLVFGELSLDGKLRPIKGALAFSLLAQEQGIEEIILPRENATEAATVLNHASSMRIIGAETLKDVVGHLSGKAPLVPTKGERTKQKQAEATPLSFIKGQGFAKRALEIAAAGHHNLLFYGPPGTGKTLLAKALSSLLPELEREEALEVTKIYSIAGLLSPSRPFITQPPFRSPHHSSSEAALIGGGNPPKAGEITLAHRGVLFLDELPEVHRDVLESLREPLEEGRISILRARHHVTFPSRFMFVAAANPCPCGFYRDPERDCSCTPSSIYKYKRKLSGPLMDRMDLFVEVPQIKYEELAQPGRADQQETRELKSRIKKARTVQHARFRGARTNAAMSLEEIQKHCGVDEQSSALLRQYVNAGKLSARGFHRVLKVARSIADLEEAQNVNFSHVSEALSYRMKED